jgi:hypothetical protein
MQKCAWSLSPLSFLVEGSSNADDMLEKFAKRKINSHDVLLACKSISTIAKSNSQRPARTDYFTHLYTRI